MPETKAKRRKKSSRPLSDLECYSNDLEKFCGPLSREESVRLFAEWKAGNLDARKRLIESVLRLANRIAIQFSSQQVPVDDLIGEANAAAIRAVDAWNPSRGALSVACGTYVRNALKEYLWRFGHKGIYIPIQTLYRITGGDLDDRRMVRRCELQSAQRAMNISRFSELSRDDDSPLEVADDERPHTRI